MAKQFSKTKKPLNMKGKQGSKDSRVKRVNFDNERESKFENYEMRQKTKADNDASWYGRNPKLLQAAASLNFITTNGVPLELSSANDTKIAVPGVMRISYAPTLGPNGYDIVRQAQDSIYSYTVHANSRNQSYDAPDEMLLILAGIEVFSAIALGIRAYGVMKNYEGQNLYTPNTLLTAMGFNAADLHKNYSHMLFDLNDLIAQSRQIWIPNTLNLTTRRFWMNSNVYMDGESVKAQYYLFTPEFFYKFNPIKTDEGGGLDVVPWTWVAPTTDVNNPGDLLHTWEEYINIVQSLITALINTQDRGLIFGDILKAYGEDNIYKINEIAPEYKLDYAYSKEVLSQIENATSCIDIPTGVIQQTNGSLFTLYANTVARTDTTCTPPENVILNFHQAEQPTPEQIVVATRLLACQSSYTFGTISGSEAVVGVSPRTCGTEYMTRARVYYRSRGTSGATITTSQLLKGSMKEDHFNVGQAWAWAACDWAPTQYLATDDKLDLSKPESIKPRRAMCDYENYIVVDYNTLQRIHIAAILSLFGVPNLLN